MNVDEDDHNAETTDHDVMGDDGDDEGSVDRLIAEGESKAEDSDGSRSGQIVSSTIVVSTSRPPPPPRGRPPIVTGFRDQEAQYMGESATAYRMRRTAAHAEGRTETSN